MQKNKLLIVILGLVLMSCQRGSEPTLRQGDFFTEEEGREELKKMESLYSTMEEWEVRKASLRASILDGLNLSPLPERTPLHAMIGSKRVKDGYSVENVSFECIPGFYVCGNLYRPLEDKAPAPIILCPHGHFSGDSLDDYGRFRPDMQKRCATLARMGAVVISYNMFGYGESLQQLDPNTIIEEPDVLHLDSCHNTPLALTMQTWSSMRALDFMLELPGTDPSKTAITGASGGGTQTFLLAALDDRVGVSVPVVMVSCHFFGGCGCESGLPIHQSAHHFTNNAEIAAMMAPKPMLMISDGADWTKNEPVVEYPFIKRTYSFYKAESKVENVHFPDGVHDYNADKRVPVYGFLAKHLGLDLSKVQNPDGSIDESKSEIEPAVEMLSFSRENPFPAHALKGTDAIEQQLKKLQ